MPNFPIAQDVLEHIEVTFQDVSKSSMQAYIKYKVSHEKKTKASKLKERHYVYVLQTKTDHECSIFAFTDFRRPGPISLKEPCK